MNTRIVRAVLAYRQGYYVDKPYRSLSGPEREFKLLQTLLEGFPRLDFPVRISAEYFPQPAGHYRVPVLLSFDQSEIRLLSDTDNLNLEIIILARDLRDVTRAGVRDRIEIRSLSHKEQETRFIYQNLLVLDPDRYQLVALLRDNRSGLISRIVHSLNLPVPGLIRPSSLVLASR